MILLMFSFGVMAQTPQPKKEVPLKDQMDEGDKLLLARDVCRKPMEALETKFEGLDKKQLEKMKKDCQY